MFTDGCRVHLSFGIERHLNSSVILAREYRYLFLSLIITHHACSQNSPSRTPTVLHLPHHPDSMVNSPFDDDEDDFVMVDLPSTAHPRPSYRRFSTTAITHRTQSPRPPTIASPAPMASNASPCPSPASGAHRHNLPLRDCDQLTSVSLIFSLHTCL
jgi:hypothetical protein